jgi:hypothetical protein
MVTLVAPGAAWTPDVDRTSGSRQSASPDCLLGVLAFAGDSAVDALVVVASVPELDSPVLDEVPAPVSVALDTPSAAGFFDPLDDLRSTLAQPEPLKWIVGATNALRIVAPQIGHAVGPESCTPCMTSVTWPLAQT